MNRKRLAFWGIFAALLIAATLAAIEFLASFFVPPWPAWAFSPRPPAIARTLPPPFDRHPWLGEADNSWSMRDRERMLAKRHGVLRGAFVGDSFVESRFTRLSLPAAVQQRLDPGEQRFEAVNLGISNTDPRSYYYRVREVVSALRPDAVLLFVYAGNDFMQADQGHSPWPRLIDESAGGSLLGWVLPRTNWLVNRLDVGRFLGGGRTAPADAEQQLFQAVIAPPDERLARLTNYARRYIDPPIADTELTALLGRGDQRLLGIARPQDGEQEFLMDWLLRIVLSWEAQGSGGTSPEDIRRAADHAQVEATLSWLLAVRDRLRERGVPLLLFLVPTGAVDPDYRAFWSPWPRAYAWNRICQDWQSQLMTDLRRAGLPFVDLGDVLDGIPGTYRKLDGHWTERGLAIVADRVAREVESKLLAPRE